MPAAEQIGDGEKLHNSNNKKRMNFYHIFPVFEVLFLILFAIKVLIIRFRGF